MAEGKCANCARYLLIFFNLIFWIIGMVLIGMGIWIIAGGDSSTAIKKAIHLQLDMEILENAGYAVIGLGSFMFFIGFCGCCGAIRESAIMLGVYMAFMVVLLIGEFAAIIYIILEKSTIETLVRNQLHKDVRNYTGDTARNENNFTFSKNDSAMDFLQVKFDCCGADNLTDYRNSYRFEEYYLKPKMMAGDMYVPDSCCVTGDNNIPAKPKYPEACQLAARTGVTNSSIIHTQGCFTILRDLIDDNSAVLIGISAGIICLEIIVLVFAVFLCRNRTQYEYEYEYDD